jgi:dihydrofolate synthase/folylpolyglutamate synthase
LFTYKEALDWLFTQLPMYQRTGKAAYKADLQNTLDLDKHLDHPHTFYRTIHIAGTNGKGSTSHMIASILQEAGYKVGLYTSPHLNDFRERIRVNGVLCEEQFVTDFVNQHKQFFNDHKLSFFEMTVGMAFQYFKEQKVDIAVVETGLGGRLDSTNIITPMVTAITNIDKDHTAILGNTFIKIAGEKAGIIKRNIPIVIGEHRGFLKSRFRESGLQQNAPIYFIDHRTKNLPTDLKGHYQKSNARLAVKVIELLKESKQIMVSQGDIQKGLLQVAISTGLRGRYDVLKLHPKIIADTAHNSAGIKLLIKQVNEELFKELHIILGMVSDKDAASVIKLLPKKAHYYISKPDIPRGMSTDTLGQHLNSFHFRFDSFNSINQAFKAAKKRASKEDIILITGSTFVVAEII